jgi:hypothetical protein
MFRMILRLNNDCSSKLPGVYNRELECYLSCFNLKLTYYLALFDALKYSNNKISLLIFPSQCQKTNGCILFTRYNKSTLPILLISVYLDT